MIVTTPGQLREVLEAYLAFDTFAFDVETKGEHRGQPRRNEVFWLSLAGPGRADVIPMGHPLGHLLEPGYKVKLPEADCPDVKYCERCSKGQRTRKDGTVSRAQVNHNIRSKFGRVPEQLDAQYVFDVLRPLFLSDRIKVGQNVKFDAQSLVKYLGELMPGFLADTLVMAKLLDENHNSYALGEQVERIFQYSYDKSLGKEGVDKFGFDEAAKYSYLDAKYTWLLYRHYYDLLEHYPRLWDLFWTVEVPVTRVVCKMELAGAPVDRVGFQKLHDDLDFRIRQLEKEIEEVNEGRRLPGSGKQLVDFIYNKRGYEPTIFTDKTNEPSTSIKALEVIAYKNPRLEPDRTIDKNIKDPIVAAIIERGQLTKLHGTYMANNLEAVQEEGKLYGQFDQYGADTGRFSCVAGSTLLPTSRGTFTFEEYEPVEGDLVLTHEGRWMPVERKIYKGIDWMYRVGLANGSNVECTREHRLLTTTGWVSVGELSVGDEVLSVGIEELHPEHGEHPGSAKGVPGCGQADNGTGSSPLGHDVPECAVGYFDAASDRAAEGRARPALFTSHGGLVQWDDRREWLPAPQLQGADPGWERVPATEGRQAVCAGAPSSDGRAAWAEGTASVGGRAPYRLGQDEQRPEQPRPGDQGGPPASSCSTSQVVAITSLGAMGVWDIDVAGDHSYLTQGFFHHNSREPNLQNIPIRQGKEIRDLFIAGPGRKLIVADYSQVELRILAHFTQDPTLLKAYREGLDLHTITARTAYGIKEGEEVSPKRRGLAKNVNFSVIYMGTAWTIMTRYEVPEREAEIVVNGFHKAYPKVEPWQRSVIKKARERYRKKDTGQPYVAPYVETVLGRRRRLPQLVWPNTEEYKAVRRRAERQAVNAVIQGTAADIAKLAMIELDERIESNGFDWQLLMVVHDEFVVSVPEGEAEKAARTIEEAMASVNMLSVPLEVGVSIVDRWSDGK